MIPQKTFHLVLLVWFFGWGFLLTKFPQRCYRIMSWGQTPHEKQIRRARIVGYMGWFFGTLLLIQVLLENIR
jgi:hypothetical protein